MKFELVTGGAGSGKSGYIESKIEECITEGLRAVIIVPERFSHMEESTLCARFGGLGINGVEVSTFSKLAKRLENRGEYLMPSGRQMLILKAGEKCADAGDGIFKSAMERSGFLEQIGAAIGEFKRCMITPQTLTEFKADGYLGRKMNALGEIYREYNELLNGKFADPDEDMELLGAKIEADGGFSDARIFIDGFSDFLPAHYCVISSILKWADKMYVTLPLTEGGMRSRDGVFAPVVRCADKLIKTAAERGAEVKRKHFDAECRHIKAADIRYFIQNYDEYDPSSGSLPQCTNISVTKLFDRHAEVERLAGRIMYEVRENGLRFRDIGVISGNADSYTHIIDAVFSDCGIPYFTDKKMPASEHRIIRLVMSVFRVINENWSFSSVFEYLRCGLIFKKNEYGIKNIEPRVIDALEDYARKFGVRGKKAWLGETAWKPKKAGIFDEVIGARDDNNNVEWLDGVRRELMQPFVNFCNAVSGRRRVRELAAALFGFLNDINLYEGLLWEQKRMEGMNMLDDAARLGEIWNILIAALDQAVLTMGDEYISRERFARLLEAGLTQSSVDTVPSGADRVSIGSADASRPVQVKALFVIGALRGELPKEGGEQGILNDADRLLIEQSGIELLPSAEKRSELTEYQLYSALTAACERIYISYPENSGESSIVSPLIDSLLSVFPDLKITAPDDNELWENIFISPKRTYYKMLSDLAMGADDEERDFWQQTFTEERGVRTQRFNKKAQPDADCSIFDNCTEACSSILERAERYKTAHAHITPETAFALYGGRPFSITSLQMYNKCPFSYFVKYGLGVNEQEEYKLRSYDIGELIHWAVCEFCAKVQSDVKDLKEIRERWCGLDNASAEVIISGLCADIAETAKQANPDFGAERLEYMCTRARSTLSKAVRVIRESLVAGGFSACCFEKEFNIDVRHSGEAVNIKGVIDRLDMTEDEKGAVLRIIDYKTGTQSFSIAGICNKTDLQLMIYAIAAKELYNNGELPYAAAETARVGAVLYNKVREDLEKRTDINSKGKKENPIDGVIVTVGEPQEVSGAELTMHDTALSEGGAASTYLPLKTLVNGTLGKSKKAISAARFERLTDYAAKTACETKAAIYRGEASALPVENGNMRPCGYCPYADICLHDDARDGVRKQVTNEDAAWEMIEGGESSDE